MLRLQLQENDVGYNFTMFLKTKSQPPIVDRPNSYRSWAAVGPTDNLSPTAGWTEVVSSWSKQHSAVSC